MLLVATASWGEDDEHAWRELVEVRNALIGAGGQLLDFDQTFVPAGFLSGDTESGRVALDLPDCLRWDYGEPFPKSFLLCHARVHAWNPGEPVGRIFVVDEDGRHGLDLLRLSVPDLRQRYTATFDPEYAGTILLQPLVAAPELRDVEIELNSERTMVSRLAYRDAEGNQTEFRFSRLRPIEGPRPFEPPADLTWERDGGGP